MEHLGLSSLNLDPSRCTDNIVTDVLSQTPSFHTFTDGTHGFKIDGDELKPTEAFLRVPERTSTWPQTTFVQRWLFFEVLREFFHDVKDFDVRRFTKATDRGLAITTEPLKLLLEKWESHFSGPGDRLPQIIRIQSVLLKAKSYAYKYLSTSIPTNGESSAQRLAVRWSQIDDAAALVILVLGETLSDALEKVQREKNFMLKGWCNQSESTAGWGYSKLVLRGQYSLLKGNISPCRVIPSPKTFECHTLTVNAGLNRAGWSWDSIDLLKRQFKNSTVGLLHALVSNKPPTKSTQSDDNYKPYHHCTDGGSAACGDSVTVEKYQDVINIIMAGNIPLFRYNTENEKLIVHGTPMKAPEPYMVFSHVWADGFGNPKTNKLPLCVLKMLSGECVRGKPVRGRQHKPGRVPDKISFPFWIDTLAIPVGNAHETARSKAISMIHKIYDQARVTFVLDKGLMQTNRGYEFTRMAMSISLSNWSRRLWTLQEVVLSTKVYFLFQDDACSLRDLEKCYKGVEKVLYTPAPGIAHSYYKLMLGPTKNEFIGTMGVEKVGAIGKVWKATQWRTTTHRHHETLSLATLFNLPTKEFGKVSNKVGPKSGVDLDPTAERTLNEYMQMLLTLLANKLFQIPVEFMFLPGPYLPDAGFRWAPRTWLFHQRVEHPGTYAMCGPSAELTGTIGLQVTLPGIKLHGLQYTCERLKTEREFCFATNKSLLDWYQVEKASPEESWFRNRDLGEHGFAIIHLENDEPLDKNIGLLVTVVAEAGHALEVKILCRVLICKVSEHKLLQDCKSKFHEANSLPLCYGEKLSNQKWRVDGVDRAEIPEPTTSVKTGEEFQSAVQDARQSGLQLGNVVTITPSSSPPPPQIIPPSPTAAAAAATTATVSPPSASALTSPPSASPTVASALAPPAFPAASSAASSAASPRAEANGTIVNNGGHDQDPSRPKPKASMKDRMRHGWEKVNEWFWSNE